MLRTWQVLEYWQMGPSTALQIIELQVLLQAALRVLLGHLR